MKIKIKMNTQSSNVISNPQEFIFLCRIERNLRMRDQYEVDLGRYS